eukprot:TRINITY_DN8430_c0_g1_i4.p1 TRINITY_DN8430_c0_g1~~TRINITY_DN8430_c0_g1_i4.p1  ORF type:complete len:246 (-),score=58.08 TRINITY_DN8430_c0_g1_i4:227-964(-)
MSGSHARTHSTALPAEQVAELQDIFRNQVLRDIQLAYVLTKCYQDPQNPSGTDNAKGLALGADQEFMQHVERVRAAYRGDAGHQALCHGDLHAGSVMVDTQTGGAKVIDPEFCVYGPPGVDVGSLLASIVLAGVNGHYSTATGSVQTAADAVTAVWDAYSQRLLAEGLSEEATQEIAESSIGFMCCEVARTSLGFAGVRCLQVEPAEAHELALDATLGMVRRCMLQREGARSMELVALELRALAE